MSSIFRNSAASITTLEGYTRIRLFLMEVAAQDRRTLAKQLDMTEAFSGPRIQQDPGDLLGARVAQLYRGECLAPAEECPFSREQ